MFKVPDERAPSTRLRMTVVLEPLGIWLKGSATSMSPRDSTGLTSELASLVFSVAAAAFRAALAFAMLSRKALDDLDTFLDSFSACCSGVSSSCRVDAADTYREAVDGDLSEETGSVWGFLVFRTWRGRSGGGIFEREDLKDALGEGRTLGLFGGAMVFLDVALLPGTLFKAAILRLLVGIFFNLEGLSRVSVLPVCRSEDEAIDIRDRDGKRNLETG